MSPDGSEDGGSQQYWAEEQTEDGMKRWKKGERGGCQRKRREVVEDRWGGERASGGAEEGHRCRRSGSLGNSRAHCEGRDGVLRIHSILRGTWWMIREEEVMRRSVRVGG
jgi:hypothetical protein